MDGGAWSPEYPGDARDIGVGAEGSVFIITKTE